jgi:hypothetical protein
MEAEGMLTSAERTSVETAIDARLAQCARIVPLDDGVERRGWSGLAMLTGAAGGSIAPIHYRIDVPADALSVTIAIRPIETGSYRVYARWGAPVEFSAPSDPPIVADASYDASTIVIDTNGEIARCQTLHLAVVTTDLYANGPSFYRISASIEHSGLDEPCADPADSGVTEVPSGGCACRVSRAQSEPSFLLLLFALVAIRCRSR